MAERTMDMSGDQTARGTSVSAADSIPCPCCPETKREIETSQRTGVVEHGGMKLGRCRMGGRHAGRGIGRGGYIYETPWGMFAQIFSAKPR